MSEKETESRGRKVYRAKSFAMSVMACPGCHVSLADPVDQCPRCGYTGHDSMTRFSFPAPSMSRFIDPAGHFLESDRARIGKGLGELAKKFPQARICFCVIDLAEETDPREFGFWLMNASPVDGPEEAEMRPWTILLVIDDINGRASVTPGYAIEPFLDDQSWQALIRRERQHFFGRDYVNAALKFIEGATEILMDGANRADKNMKKKSTQADGKVKKGKRRTA